jgi:hypothetical protein
LKKKKSSGELNYPKTLGDTMVGVKKVAGRTGRKPQSFNTVVFRSCYKGWTEIGSNDCIGFNDLS